MKIDDTLIWYANLADVALRGEWYSSGDVPVSVAGVGSTFDLTIELKIEATITMYPDTQGFINAYYIRRCVKPDRDNRPPQGEWDHYLFEDAQGRIR